MEWDIEELTAVVAAGLQMSEYSASKWNALYDLLAKHFELEKAAIRASLLNKTGNLTNRVYKDNAWENPTVLALICTGEIGPAKAEEYLENFARGFYPRLGVFPRLRVVLIFEASKLVTVREFEVGDGSEGQEGASSDG